jgi:membrane protease YdiL (CAAX protease family)
VGGPAAAQREDEHRTFLNEEDHRVSWTSRALRQAALFMAIALGLALAVAVIAPKTGELAPMISIAIPLIAVAIVITWTIPAGRRLEAWREVRFGLGRSGWRWIGIAVALPAVLAVVSFTVAAAVGVVRFDPSRIGVPDLLDLLFMLVVFSVVFLGEEIGWRGFLLPRLATAMPFGRAALAAGLAQGTFHLPLYLIGATYMAAGSRWVVVPLAMVSFTFGGVFYAWLWQGSHSIWPVAVGHIAFNAFFSTLGNVSVVVSPVGLPYLTNETGAITAALIVVAAFVLLRRSRVYRAEPQVLGAPVTGTAR